MGEIRVWGPKDFLDELDKKCPRDIHLIPNWLVSEEHKIGGERAAVRGGNIAMMKIVT